MDCHKVVYSGSIRTGGGQLHQSVIGSSVLIPQSGADVEPLAGFTPFSSSFFHAANSERRKKKKRKATTLLSGRASGISARPGSAGRNFWGAPTAKIDGHQSGCSKKKIASIFIHFGLFFWGPKVSEWIDAVAAIHWANRSSVLPLNQGPPLPPANSSDAVAAEM